VKKLLGAAAAVIALASAGSAFAGVVYSEDFSGYDSPVARDANTAGTSSTSGNSFTTDYAYRSGSASTGSESLYDEGTWTIGANPYDVHNLWVDLGDAENPMLILNGKTSASGENPAKSWVSNAFTVDAGDYLYSFDLINVCCNSNGPYNQPSTLWFYFTDTNGASYQLASNAFVTQTDAGVAYKMYGGFNLASGGSLRVALFDTNGIASGNDFAVDNILVSTAPEPATWAMMIMGFGAAGAAMRRRRAVAA